MKLLASILAASVSGLGPALSPEQRRIQQQSRFNNWYNDLTDRRFINENFALQYDELVVQVDVFSGQEDAACNDINSGINAGCQFFKLLSREMDVLAPQSRYDERLNSDTHPDRSLYCNDVDGVCPGIMGSAMVTKIRPSFTGDDVDYTSSKQNPLTRITNSKGWVCVFPQAGPVSCLFLGDLENCRKIHNLLASSDSTEQVCDHAAAKEYCWRHGAELALPDFLTMSSVVEPLCSRSEFQISPNFVMSVAGYWLDARKVDHLKGNSTNIQANLETKYSDGEYFNIFSNSKFNIFGKFQNTNRFTGIQTNRDYLWAKADRYNNNLESPRGSRTDYEILLRSHNVTNFEKLHGTAPVNNIWGTREDRTTSNREWAFDGLSLREDEYFSAALARRTDPDLDIAFDTVYQTAYKDAELFGNGLRSEYGPFSKNPPQNYYKNLFSGNAAVINEFRKSMGIYKSNITFAGDRFHEALMVKSVRDTLGSVGSTDSTFSWSESCLVMECSSSGNVEYNVISCNQVGVRPLCVMDSFISVRAICPKNAGVNFCGANVKPFLVSTVYGNVVKQYKYDSQGTLQETLSSFKLGDNGLNAITATSDISNIQGKDDNVIAALNRYLVQKNVRNEDGSVHQRQVFMQCDTINAAVDGPAAIGTDGRYRPDFIKSYNRRVCEDAGWVYNRDTNVFTFDFTAGTKFTSNSPCQCDPCEKLTWENIPGHRTYTKIQVERANAYVHDNRQAIIDGTAEFKRIANSNVKIETKILDQVAAEYDKLKSRVTVDTLTNALDVEFHCCAPGMVFKSDTGYNYGNIAISQRDNTPGTLVSRDDTANSNQVDCGISFCQETSNSATGLFWSSGTKQSPKKERVDLNGKVHAAADRVHGKCVPLQCLRPKCDATTERYDESADIGNGLYDIGQTYGSCRCPCDSSFSAFSCSADTNFVGRMIYQPPTFKRVSACGGESCRAPFLDQHQTFTDISSAKTYKTNEIIAGNQIRVTCARGFQLQCRPGNENCEKNTGLITCTRNSETCVKPMLNPFECKEIFCENPCNRVEFDIEVKGNVTKRQYRVGETVECQCKAGLVAGTGACRSTCGINGAGVGTFVNQCSCGNSDCKLSCDIPNGRQYTNNLNKMSNIEYTTKNTFVNSAYLSKGAVIGLNDHVFMNCKEGFVLRYSHNDEVVGANQHDKCARQCYKDPKTLAAKLDQIACYCAPTPCPSYTPAVTHQNADYKTNFVYWPDTSTFRSKFNQVCSTCKGGSFSTKFGNRPDCVTCTSHFKDGKTAVGWGSVGQCIEEVCPDPRGQFGAQMMPTPNSASLSMNLRHTISSLDVYRVPDSRAAANFTAKSYVHMTFGDQDLLTDLDLNNARLPFTLVDQYDSFGDEYFPFYKEDGAKASIRSKKINSIEGTRATFTCMKGFAPYLNWPEAVEANNFGPMVGNSFECVCKHGKWCCKHHCRCEKFCPIPKCVGC